jgi:hypothetical protein
MQPNTAAKSKNQLYHPKITAHHGSLHPRAFHCTSALLFRFQRLCEVMLQ